MSSTSPHSTRPLDDSTVLRELEAERLALCVRLDGLDPDHWSTPSLCEGWTAIDVAAHLALATRESKWDFVKGMLRHRGNFDRMTAENAIDHARRHSPDEIVAQLRATAGSAGTALGSSVRDCLIDVIVHTQDIGRPVDRRWTSPPDRVVIALEHALASRWYGAKKRFADITLRATDIDWTNAGGGSMVSGPSIDLLLVATGRPYGHANLTGAGVQSVRKKLAT